MTSPFAILALLALTSCGLSSCGLIGTGGFPVLRDPVPDGEKVASGSFETVNETFHEDKTVSGLAIIYLVDVDTYVVRLQTLSAPEESDLLLEASAGGQTVLQTNLRSPYGNQNYTLSMSGSPNWTSVTIKTPRTADPVLAEYGVALLVNDP